MPNTLPVLCRTLFASVFFLAFTPLVFSADWADFASISPTATFENNHLCYSDGRDIACGDREINISNSGNVSLGSSDYPLKSSGIYMPDRSLSMGTNGTYIGFGVYWNSGWKYSTGTQAGANIRIGQTASSEGGDIQFHTAPAHAGSIGDAASLERRMVIKNSGNVGIARNSPLTLLDVAGTIRIADGGEDAATAGAGAIKYDTGALYFSDGSTWTALADTDGVGATSIDELSDAIADYTTDYNMFLGSNAGANTTTGGQYNIALGEQALENNTTGDSNTAIGYQALEDADSQYNTALGYQAAAAGAASTTATDYLTAVGYRASYQDTGSGSSGLGYAALYQNTGDGVSALGYNAARENTGDNVSVVGTNAAYQNTGSTVTAVGVSSAYQNTGNSLSAFGINAAYQNTGNYAVGVGYQAIRENAGSYVSSLGNNAAYLNAGDYVSAVGHSAAQENTANNLSAFGVNASRYRNAVNSTIIGTYAGHGGDTTRRDAPYNTFIGHRSGYNVMTGANNVFLGYQSGDNITTGSNNIAIGYDIDVVDPAADNQLNIANTIYGDTSAGSVGIGTTAPAYALDVSGTSRFTGIMRIREGNAEVVPRLYLDPYKTLDPANGASKVFAIVGTESNGENLAFTMKGEDTSDRISFMTDYGSTGTFTERMTILANNGYVGINNTTPSTTLDVSGTLRIADGGEAAATAGAGAIKYDTGALYFSDGSTWTALADTGGVGATSIDELSDGKYLGSSVYLGSGAGNAVTVTTDLYNTAVGSVALNSNTTGQRNTALGQAALRLNVDGDSNTAIGVRTLQSLISGFHNTAIGERALEYQAAGNNLSALGRYAGRYIADGSTFLTNVDNSLFLGANTKALADGGTNETVIGYNATGLGNNSVVLGNDSVVTTALKGNVGIGTTSPGATLHIEHATPLLILTDSETAADSRLSASSSNGSLYLDADFNDESVSSQIGMGVDGVRRLFIKSTGRIGISTESPATALDVSGTLRIADGGETAATAGAGAIKYDTGALYFSDGSSWSALASAAATRTSITDADGDTSITLENAGDTDTISFTTAGVERMIIDSSGRVGIGTTSPSSSLHIDSTNSNVFEGSAPGDAYMSLRTEGASNKAMFRWWNDVTPWTLGINGSDANKFQLSTKYTLDGTGIIPLTIRREGNVGIGTTDPKASLHISGSSSGVLLEESSGGADNEAFIVAYNKNLEIQNRNSDGTFVKTPYLFSLEAPSASLYVSNSGYMGLGTTAPSTTLDVSGTLRIADGGEDAATAGAGAIKYDTGALYFSDGSTWTALADTGDVGATSIDELSDGKYLGQSVYLGSGAGDAVTVTTDLHNTAIGRSAMQENTTGKQNVALGASALFGNTTGDYNTAVGQVSLRDNTTGNTNTAIGHAALISNISGHGNTALGVRALQALASGSYNVAIGERALEYQAAGSTVSALGHYAGRYIADGSTFLANVDNSLFLGAETKALADGGTNETVIGYDATGLGDNSVVLGNDSVVTTALKGSVGIGTTEPSKTLHVVGNTAVSGTVQVAGTGGETCGPGAYGTIRYNPSTDSYQMCVKR